MQSNIMKIILLITLFAVLNAGLSCAETIGGYDRNTELNLSGIIMKEFEERKGPRMFLFKSNERVYHLITGPRWYLWQIGLSLRKGEQVEIMGSKMCDREGNVFLRLSELRKLDTGELYWFRDKDMKPLWRGRAGVQE